MKRFFRLIFLVLLAVTMLVLWNVIAHGREKTATEGKQHLRILTYNTHRMGCFKHVPENEVIQFLQNVEVDVMCLQEVEVYKNDSYLSLNELKSAFSHYPYTYFDFKIHNSRRQFGNVVFSKYPLINKHTINYESRASISSCCDMVVGVDTLRLFINHLESNRFENEDFLLPDSLSRESLRQSATRISQKMDEARTKRIPQAKTVHQQINASPYPVLVVGDFNSTPISFTYLCMKRGLTDCFLTTHFGSLGNTYVLHHLGLRIDYILCSPSLTPLSSEVIHVKASDHYPLQATIEW